MRPLRILHVTAPAAFGGLEHVVCALARGHVLKGHDVHVCAVLQRAEPVPHNMAALQSAGVALHVIRLAPRAYIRERRELRALITAIAPDVVHTHGYRADVIGGLAARSANVPVVTTVHGFTGGGWRNRFYERLQVHALKRFSGVAAVSRLMADSLARAGLTPDRLHVVPNAWSGDVPMMTRVEARSHLGLDDDHVHLGWVGRLSAEKGGDVVIDALALLQDPRVRLSIIGTGSMQTELQQRANRSGVADQVHWHGAIPDAARVFSAFDVFVLSSRTEGTPIVLFEAVEARIPIVATAVGGVPDVLSADEAVLVEPGSPAALARGIRRVLGADGAEVMSRVARAGARVHAQFAPEPWLARYELLYRNLVTPTAQ